MSTKFKKGSDPRRNTKGRPAGVPNQATKQIRELISNFLNKNLPDLQAEYEKLDAKEKLMFFERLLRHVLPPVPPENLLEGMSDEDLEKLVKHLRRELK